MNNKIGLFIFLMLTFFSCNKDTKFDSEKWKSADGENILLDTRLNMTSDLIESEILINKGKSEIKTVIGGPTRLHAQEVDSIKYYAIQEIYSFGIDPEEMIFLKIIFNEKGKSISVEMYSTK